METITMKLNSPITDEQWNTITDAELEHSDEIEFTTPSGKKVMYAKVRHGHWIKVEKIYPEKMFDTTYAYLCSECHHSDVHSAFIRVRYCWNCGALMDLKEVKAESVVRCKDCILDREAQCPMKYGTEADDYCSFGEWKIPEEIDEVVEK